MFLNDQLLTENYLTNIEELYISEKEKKCNKKLLKMYLSFLVSKKFSTLENNITNDSLIITNRGLATDINLIKKHKYVQLCNNLSPLKKEGNFFIGENGKKIDTNDERYYFILDTSKNLYLAPPYINGEKWITHSSLLHDNWPILAGHIVVKAGKVCYLDEESGHFKPRRCLHFFTDIFGWDVTTSDCYFNHCNLDKLPEIERSKIKKIQELFDFYKYIFYNEA